MNELELLVEALESSLKRSEGLLFSPPSSQWLKKSQSCEASI